MGKILRTKEGQAVYRKFIDKGGLEGCPLCTVPPIKDFKYWRIVKNKFPYDLIAEKHDMLVPKRHVDEVSLNEDEISELREIKREYIDSEYSYIIEAMSKNKSIPAHFHIHLIVSKEL